MQGIIAAVPTPVDASGAPLRSQLLEHCRWALANGCDGLNVLGSTGEANSFATPARRAVMAWAATGLDVSRLMVGTGTPSLAETVELTATADDLGYAVALVLPPYYYKPVSEDGLYGYYRALHEALGARPLQIYFYNYPQLTGLVIPVKVIARLAADFPERFLGIKDSSGDLAYCREIVAALPGFKVFPSSETSLGEAAAAGFAGCISATVNASAPLCGEIWRARAAVPQDKLAQAAAIRAAIAAHPLIPAVKHMVARRTGDAVWTRALPPFAPLSEPSKAALDAV